MTDMRGASYVLVAAVPPDKTGDGLNSRGLVPVFDGPGPCLALSFADALSLQVFHRAA